MSILRCAKCGAIIYAWEDTYKTADGEYVCADCMEGEREMKVTLDIPNNTRCGFLNCIEFTGGGMNDYKELLGDIADCLITHPSEKIFKTPLHRACDAIEQLVKERDELKEVNILLTANSEHFKRERDAAVADLNIARSCLTVRATGLIFAKAVTLGQAKECVKDAPTVDAVEVVRCEKCRYWVENKCCDKGSGYCDNPDGLVNNCCYSHDFCSYGERKEASE